MHISSHGGHFFHLMEIKARHRVTDTLQLRVASEDAQLVPSSCSSSCTSLCTPRGVVSLCVGNLQVVMTGVWCSVMSGNRNRFIAKKVFLHARNLSLCTNKYSSESHMEEKHVLEGKGFLAFSSHQFGIARKDAAVKTHFM